MTGPRVVSIVGRRDVGRLSRLMHNAFVAGPWGVERVALLLASLGT